MATTLVIAGASSGVGKTTFATGLVLALKNRGRKVQPFKVGPDYLDPTYHSRASGLPSRNLDTWMLPPQNLLELYQRVAKSVDICLVEGVMGLYDGKNGRDEDGSTAALAKLLGAPVVVVMDVGKLSRTAGAIALGLQKFDPKLNLAGFLLNNVGSATHYKWVQQAIEAATGLPVLGGLPKNRKYALPERHLGLVPAGEGLKEGELEATLAKLAEEIAHMVDLDALERLATTASFEQTRVSPKLFPAEPLSKIVRLGLAYDAAFGFYYQDNLDLLQAWGAEIVPFSPMVDQELPPNLDGLYIGGGFPEVFARDLAANQAMHQAIREFAWQGLPVYAECGGLMYLCQALVDFEGRVYPMVGLLPYRTVMQNRRLKIGYAEASACSGHPLVEPGTILRGHEFHWSLLESDFDPVSAAYLIPAQGNRPEGWLHGNVLASYLHLHFGSDHRLAPRLVQWCAENRIG
ncbi:MAG: cobyrinate a,c-diamide synthase [Chloroflexota bacterium]|nr:cobyrinate a,c-diamide synthase [Chloroflexota bacterium]